MSYSEPLPIRATAPAMTVATRESSTGATVGARTHGRGSTDSLLNSITSAELNDLLYDTASDEAFSYLSGEATPWYTQHKRRRTSDARAGHTKQQQQQQQQQQWKGVSEGGGSASHRVSPVNEASQDVEVSEE